MRIKLLIYTLLCSCIAINAQNAKSILDKANQAFINAKGMKANFRLESEDSKQKVIYTQDGTIYIQGDKFKIDTPDGITWFDGKTQWSYAKGSDEVNVSNPTGEELSGLSPSVLLNIYKKGFRLRYLGEKNENEKKAYSIELIPESKKADLTKLTIDIDKSSYLPIGIKMFEKNGMINTLRIRRIETNVKLPNNTFVFNKADYPNVEMVDLR